MRNCKICGNEYNYPEEMHSTDETCGCCYLVSISKDKLKPRDKAEKNIESVPKNIEGFDEFGRPSWDSYFISLAFLISRRSIDPFTKHGTIIVSEDRTILSTGYNGSPRGCIDQNIPLTRPNKYKVLIHSECAAIINAARSGVSLKDSTFYVTGQPCEICTGQIISVGAKKIIYAGVDSVCLNEESQKVINNILAGQKIQIIKYEDTDNILSIFNNTIDYIKERNNKVLEK
jgi:dCMP deaminase